MSKGGSTTTTTVNKLPEWLSNAGQQTYTDARNYMQSNPVTPYSGQLTPPPSQATNTAASQAMASANAGQGDLDTARAMVQRATGGATPPVSVASFDQGQADRYMSPYVADVQQRTVQAMQRQNQIDNQDLRDSAQAAHAYGGTRQAVQEAEQGKAQNANILDYLAKSNEAAYESAQQQFNTDRSAQYGADTFNAGMSQADRDRELAAAGAARDTAAAASGTSSDNIRNLLMAGQGQYDQQAAGDAAQYADWQRTQDVPWQRYADLMSMLSGTPHDSTQTNTTQQQQGWLNTALAIGGMAASAFSDRRLKRNVVEVGTATDGLPIVEFDYIDEPWLPLGRFRGVMADAVARLRPWALGPVVRGFMTVNYARLGEVR